MAHNISYWDRVLFEDNYDIAVIGAGIVGCAAAIHLARANRNLKVALIERDALPDGASTRNAGFACFGSLSEICDDLSTMGLDTTIKLVGQRFHGLNQLLRLVDAESIEYNSTGGYELFGAGDEASYNSCILQMNELNEQLAPVFGGPVFIEDDSAIEALGFYNTSHLIRHPFEGVLNPGRMMKRLWSIVSAEGITILRGINIKDIEDGNAGVLLVDSRNRRWQASQVIIATNAYAKEIVPDLDVRPVRNQVYLTGPMPELRITGCFHYDRGYIYFRNIEDRLLIGGARNIDPEVESTDEYGTTDKIRKALEEFVSMHILGGEYPRFEEAWSGILGVGPEKSPIIKTVGEHIVTAVRLGGMGVALGALVGSQAAERTLSRL